MCISRYLFPFGPAVFMHGWIIAVLLVSGCQSTVTDERAPDQESEQQYDLATMDAEKRKQLLYIGLSEQEVITKWGEPEMREQSEEDKNKTTWYYTRIIPVRRYILKEQRDENTGEIIYVEEPVESMLEHISRKLIFVDGKLSSWYIYPAGMTPDMSRAVPYKTDAESP
jgi:hypothetical protein